MWSPVFRMTEAMRNPEAILAKHVTLTKVIPSSCSFVSESSSSQRAARPDICILMDYLMQSSGTENIYEWFNYFQQHADQWDIPIRKRKRPVSETSDQSNRAEADQAPMTDKQAREEALRSTQADLMKYRFIRAVHDADHVGLLCLQANGNVIKRLAYSWIAEN
jgi:hypothetical protein